MQHPRAMDNEGSSAMMGSRATVTVSASTGTCRHARSISTGGFVAGPATTERISTPFANAAESAPLGRTAAASGNALLADGNAGRDGVRILPVPGAI